jgi:hypothetical protein
MRTIKETKHGEIYIEKDGVILSAYENAIGRIDRLEEVFCKIDQEFVLGLHDTKGDLLVNWKAEPDSDQMFAACKSWEDTGEPCTNVVHYVRERRIYGGSVYVDYPIILP